MTEVSLDQQDFTMLREGLADITDAIQDSWDRDSLAKELFVRNVSSEVTDLNYKARWAFEAANVFVKVLKELKAPKPEPTLGEHVRP